MVGPTAAPTNWHRVVTPAGTAVLSYPPSFRPVDGDPLSVSVAVGRGPRYIAYLNVTPQQGNERLRNFAAFRVNLLGDDDAKRVHQDGMAQGLRFRGGQGSAVLDDYVTRVRNNHFKEIAALVVGRHGGWVIVGRRSRHRLRPFPARPSTGGELILSIVKCGNVGQERLVAVTLVEFHRTSKRRDVVVLESSRSQSRCCCGILELLAATTPRTRPGLIRPGTFGRSRLQAGGQQRR